MLAIVLVNYQSYADTLKCIESIVHSGEIGYNVFIVDNSADKLKQREFLESLSYLPSLSCNEKIFSENNFVLEEDLSILTIINAKNRGFAAANNVVLKQIYLTDRYEYVWLLNNDTRIFPGTITKYISAYSAISKRKKLGILGSVLIYEDNPAMIQGIGGRYHKALGITHHLLDGRMLDDLEQSQHYDIDYPIGASMLISLAFLRDVGLMSESYFLYFEEIDWVMRGKRNGWVCDYADDIYVFHKGGGSIGGKNKFKKKASDISDYFFYKNRLKFSYSYTPAYFPFVLTTVCLSVIYRVITRRSSFLKLFFRKSPLLQ